MDFILKRATKFSPKQHENDGFHTENDGVHTTCREPAAGLSRIRRHAHRQSHAGRLDPNRRPDDPRRRILDPDIAPGPAAIDLSAVPAALRRTDE